MLRKQPYKNDAFEAIHNSAQALHRAGAIGKETMRDFDATCLSVPTAYAPKDIQRLREVNMVSQPVFARYRNTSNSTVGKWEAGAKRPSGMALKLLAIVEKHGLHVLD